MREKGNQKKRSQKSQVNQKPQKSTQRKATIVITPDSKYKADVQTGNLSDLEMYYHLVNVSKAFAEKVVADAVEVVGDSDEEQAAYIDWRIRESGING